MKYSDHRDTGIKVAYHSTWINSSDPAPLLKWRSYCIIADADLGTLALYEDGDHKSTGTSEIYREPLQTGGAFIIGTFIYFFICRSEFLNGHFS